jgi:hypothetical protein
VLRQGNEMNFFFLFFFFLLPGIANFRWHLIIANNCIARPRVNSRVRRLDLYRDSTINGSMDQRINESIEGGDFFFGRKSRNERGREKERERKRGDIKRCIGDVTAPPQYPIIFNVPETRPSLRSNAALDNRSFQTRCESAFLF